MQEIVKKVQIAVKELFNEELDIELSRPDEQFGDYATNVALRLNKIVGRPPREIAEELANILKDQPEFTEVTVAGPGFLNLRVKDTFLASSLQKAVEQSPDGMYGANKDGEGITVISEFPSPNMAKPFSVGHLRPALQGWAVAQIMKLNKYEVITDNHLGDAGTPFGKWVVGFLRYSSDEKLEQGGINELARIYIATTADLKEEKAKDEHVLADEVQSWLQRLESDDKEAVQYRDRFNKISLDHMHQVMDRLQISTQYEYGESYFVARGQKMADELLERKIAKESDGAVIVPLDEYNIDTPVMLRKANGTALYATTDLATIEFRQKTWQPERVFIHTGQEQAFYFRQLKALAQKAGFEDTIVHLWHGLVDQLSDDGTRAKMSSRKGVILLNDLLDEAQKRAEQNMKEGTPTDIEAVALGAIKFADFMADRKKGSLFDWETMFNVQGFSGPAVQYAAVRISSILSKADLRNPQPIDTYDWTAEHNLLLELTAFPALIKELSENYELHKLAAYLYQLARTLNRYYEQTQILKSEDDALSSRLWLLGVTYQVFATGLDVLGIPIPEKM